MERDSVKIYLGSKKRSTVLIVCVLAFAFYLVCVIVAALATPEMIKEKEKTTIKCNDVIYENCRIFDEAVGLDITVEDMTKKNHFFYYEIVCDFENRGQKARISNSVYGNNGGKAHKVQASNESYSLEDDVGEKMIYVPYIRYDTYKIFTLITMNFEQVRSIKVRFSYMAIDYFNFLIATKYVFLCFTLVSIISFFINSRDVRIIDWPFETASSFIMNVSLLVFNEPLIAAYTEFFGIAYSSVSIFCNCQFLCALVMYWMVILQRQMIKKHLYFMYTVQILFVITLFVFYFLVYLYVEMNLLYNREYDWKHDFSKKSSILYQVLIAIVVIIGAWILFLMIIFSKTMIYFDFRQKALWFVNYSVILITFFFIGYGSFRLMPGGQIFLCVVSLYNIYFYLLLYLSTPDREAYRKEIEERNKFEIEMVSDQV